ncbi:MAG: hypothetical protein ACQERZ_06880, partial [Fusobacteriota bacterium]
GIIIEKNQKLYKIKNLISKDSINLEDTTEIYKDEHKYYSIYGFKVIKDKKIKRDDKVIVELEEGDKFHILEIDKSQIKEKYYLWEYFQIEE